MFSGGNNTSPLIILGDSMGNNMPVDPVVDTAITFAQGAGAASGTACRSEPHPVQNSGADSSGGDFSSVDYSANVSAPLASVIADQATPESTTTPDLGVSMYRSAASPSCRAVESGYSWGDGESSYNASDISVSGLTNPSFQVMSNLWIKDRFEENEMDTDKLSMWVITNPTTGPVTLDNVCYKHEFAFWSNWFASATYMTTEGNPVGVDYHSHENHLGIKDQQELILQIMWEKRVGSWHPKMHDYIGEFANLSLMLNAFSNDKDADNYDANVAAYLSAVDNALTAEPESVMQIPPMPEIKTPEQFGKYLRDAMSAYVESSMEFSLITDNAVPEYVMADFFNTMAPLSLTEEQIIGDTENAPGALDRLGLYNEVLQRWFNDKEMVSILKAGWYIRKAYEIAEKVELEELTDEEKMQATKQAINYAEKTMDILLSEGLLTLPVDSEGLATSLRQTFVEDARLEGASQEQLDQIANAPLGQFQLNVVKSVLDGMIPGMANDCVSNIADKERQHMVLWILLKLRNFNIAETKSQADICLEQSSIQSGEWYVVNETGDGCTPCDPGMTTNDGEVCLLSAEYCFDQYTVRLRGQDYSTHYYNVETNECNECPDNQVVSAPSQSAEDCQARPQPQRSTGSGGHHGQQQQQQQQSQSGSAIPIGMNQPF